ncbi:MAG: type VI secretion system baseplate subunit TssG, partial [Verrucomicrobia bacterium]|nr:type VI secretion system baseplate subunit TssG [Verrucomicrobiota bacterium]
MAGTNGPTTNPLIAALAEKPFAYDFNAAVRLLQSHFSQQPRIGHSSSPKQDPVRFAQSPALDFASSTIETLRQKDPAR